MISSKVGSLLAVFDKKKANQPEPKTNQQKEVYNGQNIMTKKQNEIQKPQNTTQKKIEKEKSTKNDKIKIRIEDFPKNLEDYKAKAKEIKHPIEGSKKIGKIENSLLDAIKYPGKINIKNEVIKTILFIGQSGTGKSTLINALLNFFLGVLPEYKFRYQIVLGDKKKGKDQTESQTVNIDIYNIRSPLYPGIVFRFIDTPGFGDTGNVNNNQNPSEEKDKTDKEIFLERFGTFFQKDFEKKCGKTLNAACFIVKASENRYNEFQQKIFERVTKIFATDVKENFFAIFTHNDSNSPKSKELMQKLDVFKEKEDKNEEWFWCVSSIIYFEDLKKNSQKGAYEDIIEELIKFASKIVNLKALDITLTQKNMILHKHLETTIKEIKEQNIKILLKKYENIQNYEAQLNEQIKNLKEEEKKLDSITNSIKENESKKKEVSKDIYSAQTESLKINQNLKERKDKFQDLSQNLSSKKEEMNQFLEILKKSKYTKKKIEKTIEEPKIIDSKDRNLYCTFCKNNCHLDCHCYLILFLHLKDSWWCRQIDDEGFCKICGCRYTRHKREHKQITYEQKKIVIDVDKDEKDKKEIDDKIKTIENILNSINEQEKQKKELGQKQLDIQNKENQKKNLSDLINNLENQKKIMADSISKKYKSQIEKYEELIKGNKSEKNKIEKETFGQLIKIYLLINEIKRIQMNKKIEISFEKEFNSILDNKEFILKSNLVDIIKDNFKKVLNELKDKEEKVLKEYGINKNNLLQIKEYNEEEINRIKRHFK